LTPADAAWLAGDRVVVTAGGTREPVDPVRFIGNRSSGRMGNALALAAMRHGAAVTLITSAEPPAGTSSLDIVRVETAAQMHDAVRGALAGTRVLIMAAAVADWRPVQVSAAKLTKHSGSWNLELVPTVDILTALRDDPARRGVFVVGFAAETEDAVARGRAKLERKGLDLVVVNDVSDPSIGMGADDNAVTVIAPDGETRVLERAPKALIAEQVMAIVHERLS
jgi:phosphopantothenoylcysteine decarboxylase / phosphopantothenate---cysteine ligase